MTIFRQLAHSRLGAAVLAAALILQPLATFGATITPTLAEVPIQGLNPVKPNIMLTMDDSGSMGWDFVPDFVAYAGIRHLPLPRQQPLRRRHSGSPGNGYHVQRSTIRRSAAPTTTTPSTIARSPIRRERSPTARTFRARGRTPRACRRGPAVYVNGYDGYPGANGGGTINLTTGYPDTIWCWKRGPIGCGQADGGLGRQRLRVPPQRPSPTASSPPAATPRRRSPRATTIRTTRRRAPARRNASSSIPFTVNGSSLLLHDFAGPVLFGQGFRRLGNDSLREPVGPDDLQVRPLRHRRVDVRSAGVHARRHQVDGHPRQRRVGRQSQRPHVCGGDAELRHLVLVLPDADPDDAGSDRHRLFGAGPELPRRLSHAARKHARCSRTSRTSRAPTRRPGSPSSTR